MDDDKRGTEMGEVIRIDEGRIKDHLGEMVRGTVEEALNMMLDAEADQLCGTDQYCDPTMEPGPHGRLALHRARQADAECIHRKLQRTAVGRVLKRNAFHLAETRSGETQSLEGGLQHGQTPYEPMRSDPR